MSIENVVNSPNLVTFREKKWIQPSTLYSITEGTRSYEDRDKKQSKYGWKHHRIDEIPDWLRPNQYLITGHRPPLHSVKACLLSIFRLHTDTGNIWSHIIGALLFLTLGVYELNYSENSSTLDFTEKLVFGLFFGGVVICLTMSATYHTMLCHSRPIEVFFLRLDFTGIIIITVCHYIPFIYYGFYCSPKVKAFYLILCTVLGILTIFVLLVDKFANQCYRSLRASVFTIYGSFGFLPITHYILEHGHLLAEQALVRKAAICLILMAFLYLFGAWLYSQQIPEKYFPGKCDFWFHSHQLFHIIVLIAVVVHYMGFTYLSEYKRKLPENFCQIQN